MFLGMSGISPSGASPADGLFVRVSVLCWYVSGFVCFGMDFS